jgi:lysozyme
MTAMKTSAAGRQAIIQREGVRLHAYRDSRGLWTIGVGHYSGSPYFTRWSSWTMAQVDAALASDLAPVEQAVNQSIKRPITQNQFDACSSLAFNIGISGFAGSSVVKMINVGDMATAANDFLLWDTPRELLARRESERAQFLRPHT